MSNTQHTGTATPTVDVAGSALNEEDQPGATLGDQGSDQARALDEAQHRFIDDLGQFYTRYGLTRTFGRVFALLLLSDDAHSLDDLAAQLGVSKSGISVAARDLEKLGIARRLGTPGSRRVLYEANEHLEPIFEAQFARVRQQLSTLRRADVLLAPGVAKDRLHEMLDLHEFWLSESDGIMDRWRRRRAAR